MPPNRCDKHLATLKTVWIDSPRLPDGNAVSQQDELFHTALMASTSNSEMARVHIDVSEKIRIIRHLDFTLKDRIDATYRERAGILLAILQQHTKEAQHMLTEHISQSKAEVRKITLHMLQQARLSK